MHENDINGTSFGCGLMARDVPPDLFHALRVG
jgi:hypothetical protein